MTLLAGAVGWGLLSIGALTHLWHHQRLRQLLALHLDRERLPALILTAAETVLAIAIPVSILTDWTAARIALTLVATALAVGFMLWIARLLLTNSSLPCACSFSEAPTSRWSFVRSLCVVLVAALVAIDPSSYETSTIWATFTVGLALAAAVFVVPEALSWPTASKALLARVDAFESSSTIETSEGSLAS